MTPVEYESRCAEMLRTNAHNMTMDEIERLAYGAGDRALGMMSERVGQAEAEIDYLNDKVESAQDDVSTLEDEVHDLEEEIRMLKR